jgi:hypothetical protein
MFPKKLGYTTDPLFRTGSINKNYYKDTETLYHAKLATMNGQMQYQWNIPNTTQLGSLNR